MYLSSAVQWECSCGSLASWRKDICISKRQSTQTCFVKPWEDGERTKIATPDRHSRNQGKWCNAAWSEDLKTILYCSVQGSTTQCTQRSSGNVIINIHSLVVDSCYMTHHHREAFGVLPAGCDRQLDYESGTWMERNVWIINAKCSWYALWTNTMFLRMSRCCSRVGNT